jgi:hypothetical protein
MSDLDVFAETARPWHAAEAICKAFVTLYPTIDPAPTERKEA